MKRERSLKVLYLIGMFFVISFIISFVVVMGADLVNGANLNLRINTSLNNLSADVFLKTNSLSSSGGDIYDLETYPDNPDTYAKFYSEVGSADFLIDSWSEVPRTIDLVYSVSSAQTGTLDFVWASLTGSGYDGTFTYYGDDSTYTTAVESVNMRSSASYDAVLSSDTKVYVRVEIISFSESVDSPATTTDSGGGGGGGGGGSSVPKKKVNFEISEKSYNIRIVLDEIRTRKLIVKNPTNASIKVHLGSENLNEFIILPENIIIPAFGEEVVEIKFISPNDPGVDTGKIILTSGGSKKEVLVSLNTQSRETLFDISVDLPENIFEINRDIKAQLSLLPVGEKGVDVTIKYFIKDFSGQIYSESSETFYVDEPISYVKEFDISKLNAGDYVLAAEITYIGGIASASSQFEVKEAGVSTIGLNFKFIILIVVSIFIIIAILLFTLRNLRGKKKRKKTKK